MRIEGDRWMAVGSVAAILQQDDTAHTLSPAAKGLIAAGRRTILDYAATTNVYGFNTGVGVLKKACLISTIFNVNSESWCAVRAAFQLAI